MIAQIYRTDSPSYGEIWCQHGGRLPLRESHPGACCDHVDRYVGSYVDYAWFGRMAQGTLVTSSERGAGKNASHQVPRGVSPVDGGPVSWPARRETTMGPNMSAELSRYHQRDLLYEGERERLATEASALMKQDA